MTLQSMVEEFFASGRDAAVSSDPAQLHTFRITTKHLRYTIEITKPKQAKRRLEKLKNIQDLLGNMNDAVVAETYLRQFPSLSTKASKLPENLQSKVTKHIAEFRNYWMTNFEVVGRMEDWLEWAAEVDAAQLSVKPRSLPKRFD